MKKYFLGVLIIVAIVFFINACKPKQPSVVGKWKSIDAENDDDDKYDENRDTVVSNAIK